MKKNDAKDRRKIAEAVFAGMRNGLSAFKACKEVGVNQSTFNTWLNQDAELAAEYARAREDLIERLANEVLELSDVEVELSNDGKRDWAAVQKHKLQVDTRKWLLSKLAPKKYGDRLALAGDDEAPVKIEQTIDASKLSTETLAEIVSVRNATKTI